MARKPTTTLFRATPTPEAPPPAPARPSTPAEGGRWVRRGGAVTRVLGEAATARRLPRSTPEPAAGPAGQAGHDEE